MSHRHCLLIAVGLCWSLLLVQAQGQTSIPTALKASPAIDSAGQETMRKFVAENAAKLADSSSDVVSKAREALVDAAKSGASPASPAYASIYASMVATEMMTVLDKAKEVRPRLNAAVVVAKVAEATGNPSLQPAAMRLLEEAQPEILQLWGLKAAKPILPELIRMQAHQKLLDRVLAVVKQHPTGPMTQEVYEALTRGTDKNSVKVTIGPLLTLAQTRIDAYKTGTPEDPEKDSIPFAYLTQAGVWDATLNAPQRLKAMQAICDLVSLGAQRADESGNKAHDQLITMINKVAQGVAVAGSVMNWKGVVQTATTLAKSASFAANKLTDPAKALVAEIKKVPDFTTIQDSAAGAVVVPPANP